MTHAALQPFHPAVRRWFEHNFATPTAVQVEGWAAIRQGAHALLLAPTGSGKTLAAFLCGIDRLLQQDAQTPGVRLLYVSPLKALVYDIERNLRAPLAGIGQAALAQRGGAPTLPRVGVRTGDTSQAERQAQRKRPPDILVTTPESLYLLLGSAAREGLRAVQTVIIDEVHALAGHKRGAHLALSLERLSALTGAEPQRIGLSATAQPTEVVAAFVGGVRPVTVVDCTGPPALDLDVVVPVRDMQAPSFDPTRPSEERTGIWPAVELEILQRIRAHHTTLVFVNSRGLCERLAERLNALDAADAAADQAQTSPLVRAHHGSLALGERQQIEQALKEGQLRGVVATSSLELGIDMGTIDHVVLVESPGAVSRGLQRVGRAGHAVGEASRATLFPKHRGDLLASTVVASGMRRGTLEPIRLPHNPLDVLAQQLVAMCALEAQPRSTLARIVRRTAHFHALSDALLDAVLDMLSGRYPSSQFADLRARLRWDREHDVLHPLKGTRQLSIVSGGTIADRGLYAVYVAPEGPRVGELDEEMVYETTPGQTIVLGASSWRVLAIERDRVLVRPAPGEPGRLPFWRGEGPGRPVSLGRAIGAFTRDLDRRLQSNRSQAVAWLEREHGLDAFAADNLANYLEEERAHTGTVPSDRSLTLSCFPDELGDWRICLLSPFGAQVHAPLALAMQARLSDDAGFEVPCLWSDDGILLTLAGGEAPPALDTLLPTAETVEDLVVQQLGHSALFAAQFRENAARALLLPRWRPGKRAPLWLQRRRAERLLAVASQHPSFPIVLETYRSCLRDIFDVPALVALLQAIAERKLRLVQARADGPSPFAQSLAFAHIAASLYEGDAPLAEQRAQAEGHDQSLNQEVM
ncbi:MAG: DEAD/DEAH box helicase, partial [Polyangiales bacterium]